MLATAAAAEAKRVQAVRNHEANAPCWITCSQSFVQFTMFKLSCLLNEKVDLIVFRLKLKRIHCTFLSVNQIFLEYPEGCRIYENIRSLHINIPNLNVLQKIEHYIIPNLNALQKIEHYNIPNLNVIPKKTEHCNIPNLNLVPKNWAL